MNRRLPTALLLLFSCVGQIAGLPRPATVRPGPTTPLAAQDLALDAAGQELAEDDLAGAIKALQEIVTRQPGNIQATRLLAIAYLRNNQVALAKTTAESGLKQPSLTPQERGPLELLLGRARYAEFNADFLRCLSGARSLPNMQQLLAQMAIHKHETPNGDMVIETGDPAAQDDYQQMRGSLISSITRLNKEIAAVKEAYESALADDGNLAGIHDGLGLVAAAQGYPGEAEQEFLTEIKERGPSGMVSLHLGEVDLAQNQDEEAVRHLRLAVTLIPDSPAPYDDLADIYAHRGDSEHMQWAKGMACLRRGDLPAAGAAFSHLAVQTGDSLLAQAELATTRKQIKEARALLLKARSLDPQNTGVLIKLAEMEEEMARHDEALALYHQALAIDANCGAAWFGIGLVYDAEKNQEAAVADFRQALQSNPNDPKAKIDLAADEADLGQTATAAADLHDYLWRFPTANNVYVIKKSVAALEAQ